ncbi:MAG TPA: hypothetical protein VKG23_01350 [Thermoanaerobaculia bacterium]|nr:hypothetical protein [Thermoanaerobaculia bacterium]
MTTAALPGPRAARAAGLVFGILCIYFTGVFPPFANPNELSRFQTVVAMADDHTFAIDAAIARLGDHEDKAVDRGRFYSNKAPGLAFAAYPVYRVLRLALPPASSGTFDPIFVLTRLLTVSLVCVIALRRFAARLLEIAAPTAAALVLFAVALGTPYLFYARSFFSHAWTAALLFLAWDRLRRSEQANGSGRGGRTAALAGILTAWAVISEYSVAPLAVALTVRTAAGGSRRRFVHFALGAVLPLVLLGAYDAVSFGSPWTLSSAREAFREYGDLAGRGVFGFGLPSPRIALAYLAGPARGVLLFCPFFVWSIFGLVRWWKSGRARADWWFVVAGLAVFFVLLSGYPNWHGGWSLGTRYLLPGLFFAALPIAWVLEGAWSRGLFLAAAVFSVAVHGLLTASWPHFPPEMPWPEVTGSLWFLERGWVAPNVGMLFGLTGAASLVIPAALLVWAVVAAASAARPARPVVPVAVLLGLAPLAALALRPPEPPYFGRLWRAGVYGAYSGLDARRVEFRAVALDAQTPEERSLAMRVWRWLGPRGAPTAR